MTLVGYNGRIRVDNTLDERLRLLEQQVRPVKPFRLQARLITSILQMLPELRETLFGKNGMQRVVRCVSTLLTYHCREPQALQLDASDTDISFAVV